jgi:hypothetical protein
MTIVPVDDRGRITLPKDIVPRGGKTVVIPAGSFVVVIPLTQQLLKQASWLASKHSRQYLKDLAENLARRDAVKRARRRRQSGRGQCSGL